MAIRYKVMDSDILVWEEDGDEVIDHKISKYDFWRYIESAGLNEWFEDGFNPNSWYGHTQKDGLYSMDEYLKFDLTEDLFNYINHKNNQS